MSNYMPGSSFEITDMTIREIDRKSKSEALSSGDSYIPSESDLDFDSCVNDSEGDKRESSVVLSVHHPCLHHCLKLYLIQEYRHHFYQIESLIKL